MSPFGELRAVRAFWDHMATMDSSSGRAPNYATLINVAHRLLGSAADAEDVVQEAFGRWYALPEWRRQQIDTPSAWFVRVTTRICLDVLRSARSRREISAGPGFPEPLPHPMRQNAGSGLRDPARWAVVDEALTRAAIALFESVTPAQRVVFVLHDVFDYPFAEIAEIIGRSSAACRKLAISARRHLSTSRKHTCTGGQHGEAVRRFKEALVGGDIAKLIAVLGSDAAVVGNTGIP